MEEERAEQGRRGRRVLAYAGVAALVAGGLKLLVSALNDRRNRSNSSANDNDGRRKKKATDLPGFNIRINLSASEIRKLVDQIILKSEETYDLVASIPLDKDITKPVKDELCRSLKKRRDSFAGLKLKQEVLLCLADQIIHSAENIDVVELLKHLHPKVLLGIPLLEGTNPASCFPRFAIGYEATCYSYIWSEVFAADIFASKFQDNLLNQYSGLQFRNKVFAPGGARDPLDLLCDYLGREPSIQPFIERKIRNSLWYCM